MIDCLLACLRACVRAHSLEQALGDFIPILPSSVQDIAINLVEYTTAFLDDGLSGLALEVVGDGETTMT